MSIPNFSINTLLRLYAVILIALNLCACSRSSHVPPTSTATVPLQQELDWFETRSIDSIAAFVFSTGHQPNQFTLLETVGGGVAMIDGDLDGDLDLYFAGGGYIDTLDGGSVKGAPGRFYENKSPREFLERSEQSRITTNKSLYAHGVHRWDFDQDGFPDLVITGYGGQALYRNCGDGTFIDCTDEAGLNVTGWSTASASGDFNEDGLPDLYVTRYCQWSKELETDKFCGDRESGIRDSCPPQMFAPESDLLFLNHGDGTFIDCSHNLSEIPAGRGLGVLAADFNADGKTDIYVANDAGPNQLFLKTSAKDWQDQALLAGVSGNEFGIPEGSMGIAVADVNRDEQLDILVTNFELENNSLYLNESPGIFRHATTSSGLGGAGFQYVGFGTALADFDADGWQDLLVLNGNVFYLTGQTAYLQPPLLYKNILGTFQNITSSGGDFFRSKHAGRGLAVGDLDNDGKLDFIAVDQEATPSIAFGMLSPANWARFELKSHDRTNPPIGAWLRFQFAGKTLTHWCTAGEGYLSTSDYRFLVPVDANLKQVDVTVQWPHGDREQFSNLPVKTTSILVEDHGTQVPPEETAQTINGSGESAQ